MRNPLIRLLLLAAIALAAPACVLAQTIQLAGLVGSDVGLCVELNDARGAVERVEHSAWLERLRASRLFQAWMQTEDVRRFRQSVAAIEKVVNQPPRKFLLGLFGRQAIVAVYPRTDGDPIAIVLTLAESEAAIQHAIKVWNESEPTQVEARTHAGKSYARRVRTQRKDRPAETMFYFHEGTLLALSDREDLIRQTIDRIDGDVQRSIAVNSAWQSLHGANESATVRALVQPQVWRKETEPDRPDHLPSLLRSWRTCEAITLAAQFDDGLIVQAAAFFPKDSASPRWLRFIERSRGAFPMFERIPAEALLVVATRVDLSETAALLEEMIPVNQRKPAARLRQIARGLLLGLDLPTDVLPNLGPEFTAWIAPSSSTDADGGKDNTFPWEAAAVWALNTPAVEKKPDGNGNDATAKRSRASVPMAIDNALNTGLNLLVAMFNADEKNAPAILQDETLPPPASSPDAKDPSPKERAAQGRLRWVEGLPFVEPAFAASVDRLMFATNPEAIRRVLTAQKPDVTATGLAAQDAFRTVQKRMVGSPTQLAYVNVAGVRQSLEANMARIVRHAEKSDEKGEEVEKKLGDMRDLLSLFDDVFLAFRLDETEVHATFGATLRR
ncbi:MAG: DUF3352 domain-containing protein [Planctomycetaceae bacterium]|nr:DUF3352 domain-containing protein [Planctomycetaceae bacterium]